MNAPNEHGFHIRARLMAIPKSRCSCRTGNANRESRPQSICNVHVCACTYIVPCTCVYLCVTLSVHLLTSENIAGRQVKREWIIFLRHEIMFLFKSVHVQITALVSVQKVDEYICFYCNNEYLHSNIHRHSKNGPSVSNVK